MFGIPKALTSTKKKKNKKQKKKLMKTNQKFRDPI